MAVHSSGAVILLLAVLCGGCGTYHAKSADIKRSFTASDYDDALERIESIDRGSSELLYLYELGLVLHYSDQYAESNEAFERAEMLLEELYTKSVTRELAALAITDNIARYRGQPYEAVLVNYYQILNYLYMGDLDGAVVECRRVNRKLEYLRDSEGVFFTDDPFIQYLTGLVYREALELNDADVSMRVAIDEYQALSEDYGIAVPMLLYCDAAEAGRRAGDVDTAKPDSVECPPTAGSGRGELNLFLECGFVAHKQERNVVLPIFKRDDASDPEALAEVLAAREGVPVVNYRGDAKVDYILKIALPVLVPTPVPWEYAVVRPVWRPAAPDSSAGYEEEVREPERVEDLAAPARVVENVDAYMAASFEEGYGKVVFRTIVRALAKYAAKEGVSSEDETLGWLVNWFNVATESADTRAWTTLPQKILMARAVLPEGRYDLRVDLFDSLDRRIDSIVIEDVPVTAGRSTFLNHRIF